MVMETLIEEIRKYAVEMNGAYFVIREDIPEIDDILEYRAEYKLPSLAKELGKELCIVYGDETKIPAFLRKDKLDNQSNILERNDNPEKFPVYCISTDRGDISFREVKTHRIEDKFYNFDYIEVSRGDASRIYIGSELICEIKKNKTRDN